MFKRVKTWRNNFHGNELSVIFAQRQVTAMESTAQTADGPIETPPYSHEWNQGKPLRWKRKEKLSQEIEPEKNIT